MLDAALLRELRQIVGTDHVANRRSDTEVYSYDGSLAVATPDAVVFPADTEQTAAVVRLATEAGVPYVPRGFGTNLSGGTIAAQGGLVIGLTRLNRILAIEPEGRYAVAQVGVTNLELQQRSPHAVSCSRRTPPARKRRRWAETWPKMRADRIV